MTRAAYTATAEEPVVSKQARVVEEVVVGKDVSERTETVRDKVRRTLLVEIYRQTATPQQRLQVEQILFVVTTALMSCDIEELVNSFARVTL